MAKRLISLREFDNLEGLVERHLALQERLAAQEEQAAQFDIPVEGLTDLSRQLEEVRYTLVEQLQALSNRIGG